MIKLILLFISLMLFEIMFNTSQAQTASRKEAILVSAQAQVSPPKIIFQWPKETNVDHFYVYRKTKSSTSWGSSIATLNPSDTTWTDLNVKVGDAYEYYFQKVQGSYYTAVSYLYAGIQFPAVETRGRVLLLVDDAYKTALAPEINRLMLDLVGDGWKVTRRYVSRSMTVPNVKSLIKTEWQNDKTISTLYLLGHIPVPYSALFSVPPDGHDATHGAHTGAWPADVFYGDLTGTWTDTGLDTTGGRPENRNRPGDGKYDQNTPPAPVTLQIGRVDLYQMPTFSSNDTFLMKRYLDKDHNFRFGGVNALRRGLIDDNFTSYNLVSQGWRSFAAMFGDKNIFDNTTNGKDYFPSLNSESYLWSCGSGPGSYTTCGGIGVSSDFNKDSIQSVFTMLTGSFFGDWNYPDGLLRSALASKAPTLVSFWGGIPQWQLHTMALGDCIGYCAMTTQNNNTEYYNGYFNYSTQEIHIALMGDPTLRMHVVKPPINLKVTGTTQKHLKWNKSKDAISGYYIYRSNYIWGGFTRLNTTPVTDSNYTDASPLSGTNVYMVRAVKLEVSASGSYYNLSQGVFDTSTFKLGTAPVVSQAEKFLLYPNPSNGRFTLDTYIPVKGEMTIEIFNPLGQQVTSEKYTVSEGYFSRSFDISNKGKGIYLVRINCNEKTSTRKVLIK